MTLYRHSDHPDTDKDPRLLSRRTILHRSALGITGVGATALLAACGDDEDDAPADEPDPVETEDTDAMDSVPLDPDSTAIDDDIDVAPETTEDEAGD